MTHACYEFVTLVWMEIRYGEDRHHQVQNILTYHGGAHLERGPQSGTANMSKVGFVPSSRPCIKHLITDRFCCDLFPAARLTRRIRLMIAATESQTKGTWCDDEYIREQAFGVITSLRAHWTIKKQAKVQEAGNAGFDSIISRSRELTTMQD